MYATNLPSGENIGLNAARDVSSTGLLPSMETFHTVGLAAPGVEYSTHLPSGEIADDHSPFPELNRFGLLPSRFMRQTAAAPPRVEVNTMYCPSAETTGPTLRPAFE